MNIDYAGKKYVLEFEHVYDEESPCDLCVGENKYLPIKATTFCTITTLKRESKNTWIPIGGIQGESWCSIEDAFNKSVGRKTSLTRALQEFDKDFRTFVWEEYFKIHKKDSRDTRFLPKEKTELC